MKTIRTRIAPSPTGMMHLGTARTAIYCWAVARHFGGKFLLRIEDTDQVRSTKEAVQVILDGMKWLNLDYDEGPVYQMDRLERMGTIKSVHPAVFIVEVDERRGRKSRQSYQYIDVLTGQVELFDPESGEHIFTPLGNQLEEH